MNRSLLSRKHAAQLSAVSDAVSAKNSAIITQVINESEIAPEVENMDDHLSLVLYFETDADREEFIEAFKQIKPNCKSIPL